MVMLLDATRKSEKALRISLSSSLKKVESAGELNKVLLRYKSDRSGMFDIIKNVTHFHENPILRDTNGDITKNNYTFELKKGYFLKEDEIREFYVKGYIPYKYKFPNISNKDLVNLKNEYIDHVSKFQQGIYKKKYCKLPDYVGHLYIPTIVKLMKDNYDYIVQKSMSIFNVEEEKLFFSVGIFLVDESGKGVNVHQDHSYYLLDQTSPSIATSLITFHMAVSNIGISNFSLFTGTHRYILHNLTTLKYIMDKDIKIDDDLAIYSGCISNYVINSNKLPYDDDDDEILTLSRISRYPQLIYILDKYKDDDIAAYQVNTEPGEFVIFDPAILHSNGVSTGNINELNKNFKRSIDCSNISRLSIGIRVMHSKKENNHLLWMAATEKVETLREFFGQKYKENRGSFANKDYKINIRDNMEEFYTVLSNNKLNSYCSPYFSVNEMYDFHAQSGAYQK